MAASNDLLEIVQLLNDEGFGYLAGELLLEVNLGREISIPENRSQKRKEPVIDQELVALDEDRIVSQRFFDLTEGRPDEEILRVPMDDTEQLKFAVDFIRMRLIEPTRAWAEAEVLAGDILSGTPSGRESKKAEALKIEFIRSAGLPEYPTREANPGSRDAADKLATSLLRLLEPEA